jgi:diadenosine tetraphosphate (Ap4A) HIT family hydrolase
MPTPSAPSPAWSLDPQLAKDTIEISDLPLVRTLLMNDANYPWLVLVPRLPGAVEILDLDDEQQALLMVETALIARVLRDVTVCDKLNIAAIGNIVPQLHVHVVARWRDDPAWPRPVWGAAPPRAYEPLERDRFIAAIRREVAFG